MSLLSAPRIEFDACFEALTSHRPLRWQRRLFDRLATGRVPSVLALPTGLGKTSVIPIWLIALVSPPSNKGAVHLPRRLVYVVNRRTVVDQATDVVAKIRRRLEHPRDEAWQAHATTLLAFAEQLRQLNAGGDAGSPVGVSALRGELADNEEWKIDPSRPAIVVGTIDMVGSKLLFSGYGDGRYGRAHHAGLVGQDSLIVHDEAHLSPAFDALLDAVQREQDRSQDPRRVCVMRLSATVRDFGGEATVDDAPFRIEDEDRDDPVVKQRLSAAKRLSVTDVDKNRVVSIIADRALELGTSGARVLVYVRSPEAAQEVRDAIVSGLKQRARDNGGARSDSEAAQRIGVLTGTLRGHERDALAESQLFNAFDSRSDRNMAGDAPASEERFLVSTSAGEVGADWDADHLVCDLTTLDGMIQRFGRVNRLGGAGREARVVVVIDGTGTKGKKGATEDDSSEASEAVEEHTPAQVKGQAGNAYTAAILETGELLRRIANTGGDVSPAGLRTVMEGLSADNQRTVFSPEPTILPATDILFDHWSLTSIGMVKGKDNRWRDALPGRPAIEEYLHGVAEWDPPETHVAWRADIDLLSRVGTSGEDGTPTPCSRDNLAAVFDVFPLRAAEQLRDRTDRVQKQLQAMAKRLRTQVHELTKHSDRGAAADTEDAEEVIGGGEGSEIDERSENSRGKTIDVNPWVVLIRRGVVDWHRLEDLAADGGDKQAVEDARRLLAFATVVLPVEAGGLKDGMLAGTEPAPADPRSLDVAEIVRDGALGRQRVIVCGSTERRFLGGDAAAGVAKSIVTLATDEDSDTASERIEYRVAKGQQREPGKRVPLTFHDEAVSACAARIGASLGLGTRLVEAVRLAGKWHDAGKDRGVWQRYANNANGAEPVAKSERYRHWKMLGGYRHEFGSVLDAAADPTIASHTERDLILHLIAAHHGWGRPHFEPRHFDRGDLDRPRPNVENEAAAIDAMQQFGRLQQRFGRWGLAWLEAIVRCADATASAALADKEGAR